MVAFNSRSAPLSVTDIVTDPAITRTSAQREAQHDQALVHRFRAGDDEAFAEIIARHQEKLHAVAFARLRNHADAEEIAQDTFIRAHRSLASFRGESSLATWLYRIATNLSLNRYWYFFRRCRHATQSMDRPFNDTNPATLADVVASEEPGPAREAIIHEFGQIVADCMRRLSSRNSEILHLRNGLDHSYEEIGSLLGVKVGTVKSRIARARESLRALIVEQRPEFPAHKSSEWFGALRVGAI